MTRPRQTVACPKCSTRKLRVRDHDPKPDGSVQRVRECPCGTRVLTEERVTGLTTKRWLPGRGGRN